MHRSLKEATAMPPASNLRMQQRAFDQFQEEYNQQRPHEALKMSTPSEYYRVSRRSYPSRLAEPEYGNGWEIRRVRECGRMRWWSESIFVGRALTGESIGLEPVDDGVWRVWFYGYPVGRFDERKRKIGKLEPLPQRIGIIEAEGAPQGAHETPAHTPPRDAPPETPGPLSL
jgi:hypothetical protein